MTERPSLSRRDSRDRYLAHRQTDAADASIKSFRYRLKHFVEWAEERDITAMRELTGWKLDEYETFRRGSDVSPATLNGEMQTLGNGWSWHASTWLMRTDAKTSTSLRYPMEKSPTTRCWNRRQPRNCFELCGQILHTTGQ